MKLSVLIPVYNERNTILTVIERVKKEPHEKEIIIVDDGSTDGTKALLKQIDDENIKIVFNERNRGKGFAVRQALNYMTGDIAIIQDADLEYQPDYYGVLIEKIIREEADVVYGSRVLGKSKIVHFPHYLGNQIITRLANVILGAKLTDISTGYKVFKSSCIKELCLQEDGFGIEAEITAEIFKRKYRIAETPIICNSRTYQEGKKITWLDFFKCIYALLNAYFRNTNSRKIDKPC